MRWIDDPLIGRNRRHSLIGLFAGSALAVLVIVQFLLSRFVFISGRALPMAIGYDALALLTALLVAVSLFVAVGYAAMNGGPVIAAGIALVPTLLGSILRGHLAITIDFTLAVTAATAAVWIATWVTYHQYSGSEHIDWAIALGTGLLVFSIGTLRNVSTAAGPYARSGEWAAAGFLTVGMLVLIGWALDVAWRK